MAASTEYFQTPHATPQRRDVKFFFANRGNMRKNIAQEHSAQNIITSFFQMLKMTEFLPNRLSTSLAISKSDQAFPRSSLHIMFFGNDTELKLRLHRKQLEAAKDLYFARAEKLGRWRGIKNGMSTRGTPRMRRT